ncbi:MAG: PspC domain-containing protein [Dictyoglomus sp.]
MEKRLYRSRKNRIILGVCGGLGEYFGIDPTLVRLIFILLLIPFSPIVLVYFLSALVIPEAPEEPDNKDDSITPSGPIQHL